MHKFAVALGAIAFTFGAVALPAVAAKQDGNPVAEPSTTKQALVKKTKPGNAEKYQRKCKAGTRWDASASLSAGACVKKQKVKSATKAAGSPAKQPAGKKAS